VEEELMGKKGLMGREGIGFDRYFSRRMFEIQKSVYSIQDKLNELEDRCTPYIAYDKREKLDDACYGVAPGVCEIDQRFLEVNSMLFCIEERIRILLESIA
jgi:hypothetical protein